jgi:hypothetical protein
MKKTLVYALMLMLISGLVCAVHEDFAPAGVWNSPGSGANWGIKLTVLTNFSLYKVTSRINGNFTITEVGGDLLYTKIVDANVSTLIGQAFTAGKSYRLLVNDLGNATLFIDTYAYPDNTHSLITFDKGCRDTDCSWNQWSNIGNLTTGENTTATTVVLNSPANNTWINTHTVDFNFTPSFNATIYGCFLYYNQSTALWVNLKGNTSPILNNSVNIINFTFADRIIKWNIKCNTTDGLYAYGISNRTLKIDTAMPILTIYNPKNKDYMNQSFYVDSVCTDTYIYILNYTFYNASMILNSSQVNTTNGTSLSLNVSYNISAYRPGIYTLNISCSDGHTAELFEPKAEIKKEASKITYTFDNDVIGVEILSDERLSTFDTTKQTDRYTLDMEFEKPVDRFRYKLTGEKFITYTSEYSGHTIIDDRYWFDTEPYKAEVIESGKGYIILDVIVDGKSKITTESIGGLNINTTSWTMRFGYYTDLSYDEPVLENQISTISIKLGNRTGINGKIDLIYNNTRITTNETVYNATTEYTTYTFRPTAPNVESNRNVSFYLNFTYSDGLFGTTVLFNQTVNNKNISECVGTNTSMLTIYFKDESGLYAINVSAELNFELLGISSTNASFSPINFTGSNISLCLTPLNLTQSVNAYIKYEGNGGLTHRYYMLNETLSNVTTYLTLYNFNGSSGLSQMNGVVRYSSSYNYFPGVYTKLKRYYPSENLWRIVQMDKSDEFGQIYFNIIEEAEDYGVTFEYDGIEIYDTGGLKFICSAGICSLTFTMSPYAESELTINMHPTYTYNNNTGMVSISWDDTTHSIDNVTLSVTVNSPSLSTTVCSLTSTNYTGQFLCNVSGYYGTFFVVAKEYGSLDTFISEFFTRLGAVKLTDFATFDTEDATFWIGGIIATLSIGGALISPIMAIIFAIFGLVAVSYLQFNIMITMAFIVPAIIIGIVISILMRNG